ncbi:MAG: Ig-like domain-containing protein [Gammaproteobacteria bacterium]
MILSLALLLTGCPSGTGEGLDGSGRPLSEGGGAPPLAPSATFESLQANIFTPLCTVCHAGAAAPVGLKLDAANSYAMLVGAASVQVPDQLRVAPGDPDGSYLVQKIEGTAAVGQQMPLGGPFLDSEQVGQLRDWIVNGALPPAPPTPNTPPVVLAVTPPVDTALTMTPLELQVLFSKPMDASLVSAVTVMLVASGGDGVFGDAADQMIVPSSLALADNAADTLIVNLLDVVLTDDVYELRLVSSGATSLADTDGLLLDGDGDGTAGGDYVARWSIDTAVPPPQATWRSIQDEVFTSLCVVCHVAGGQAAFLPLDEGSSYDALVGVPSIEVATALRVEPLNADDSYLVQKLEGTAAVGARMPLGGDPLPAATIAAVRSWIDTGAVRLPGDPVPDIVPPAVVVAAPLGVLAGVVTLIANASDASGVAGVDFFVDGILIGRDAVEPYEISLDTTSVSDGAHQISARAQDVAGNEGVSAVRMIEIDNAPPPDVLPPVIALDLLDEMVSGVVALSASTSDNVGVTLVRILVDGQTIAAFASEPYTVNWDSTEVADGVHTLSAQAEDAAGNVGFSAPVVTVVDNVPPPDTTPPTVTVLPPGSPFSGSVVISVEATDDNQVDTVELIVDDVSFGFDNTSPYGFDFDTLALADGDYSLRAQATDLAGNVGVSATVIITIDNAGPPDTLAPTVSLAVPDGTLSGTVEVTATATDNVGVVAVALRIDDIDVATLSSASYVFAVDTDALADGEHTFQAAASDAAGNVGVSSVISATIDNADRVAPQVTLLAPAMPVMGTASVQVMATDDVAVASVRMMADGVLLGVDSDAPFEFVWDTAGLADGAHVLEARAVDTSNNEGAAVPVVIDVANGGPQATLPWIQAQIFDVGCAAGCHIGGGIAPFLRLDADNAFDDLVGEPAVAGGSSLRVTPGDADNSALVQRLEGTLTPSMPLGGAMLPVEQIAAVRAWIDAGALAVPPDEISPAVSLGALPAQVNGDVVIEAFAVDNVALTSVRFFVNNVDVGGTMAPPFQLVWDSRSVSDGSYSLVVRAFDAAGNQGESQIVAVEVINGLPAVNKALEMQAW